MANNASTKPKATTTNTSARASVNLNSKSVSDNTINGVSGEEQAATYYPVYLNLRGKTCVIIGGGRVATPGCDGDR